MTRLPPKSLNVCRVGIAAALLAVVVHLAACEPGKADSGDDSVILPGADTSTRDSGSVDAPEQITSWLADNPTCIGEGTPLFRDATIESGAWHFQPAPTGTKLYDQLAGGGVAMADFDGDGSLDLYVAVANAGNSLLLNDGSGRFAPAPWSDEVSFPDDWTNGASAVDYDNDGDQDLYLTTRGPDRLLQNQGDGRFVDVTDQTGISSPGNSATASWADLNSDGWLDLVVAVLADTSSTGNVAMDTPDWYLADGEGGFEAMDETEFYDGSSYIMPLVDLDADGDVDVLYTQESGRDDPPSILENTGTDADGHPLWTVHTQLQFDAMGSAPMGAAILDVNDDLLPDIYTTNLWGESPRGEVLAVNQGNLEFVNRASEFGATAMTGAYDFEQMTRAVSWAAVAADFRNSGRRDLFVAYGRLEVSGPERDAVSYPPLDPVQADALFTRNADGTFTLASGSCAESVGESRGAAVGDLNGDGCLDLYVVPRRGSARLLTNRCADMGSFVKIQLEGTKSNRDAVGSIIELHVGDRVQRRWVTAGSTSVFSSSPRGVHFGVDQADRVEAVEVTWPDGTSKRVEDLAVNEVHTIRQDSE